MSGVIHGIGKIFNSVVVKPVSAVFHAVKDVAVTLWHIPIIRYAAIAVAAYFTVGAALGWFGGAAAAGGTAATIGTTGTIGTEASTIGIMAAPTTASITAASTIGTFGIGSASLGTTAFAGFTGASIGAAGTFAGLSPSAIASTTAAASMPANASMQTVAAASNLGGSMATNGFTGLSGAAQTGSDGLASSVGGLDVATPGAVSVTANVAPAATGTSGLGIFGAGSAGAASSLAANPNLSANPNLASNAAPTDPNQQPSFLSRMGSDLQSGWSHVTSLFTGGTSTPGSGGGILGGYGKMMLIQSGLQMASALLNKPQPQMQFAGVTARGTGSGLGIHTINSGFGLATGGSEAAPGGVPTALQPPGGGMTAGAYNGAQLSNAALAGGQQPSAAGNLGQTVANSAGIGGLVPQGAVNYMGAG